MARETREQEGVRSDQALTPHVGKPWPEDIKVEVGGIPEDATQSRLRVTLVALFGSLLVGLTIYGMAQSNAGILDEVLGIAGAGLWVVVGWAFGSTK